MKKILILLVFTSSTLLACTCLYSPLKESYIGSDLVFIGEFIGDSLDYNDFYGVANEFKVVKFFKGEDRNSITIFSGYGGGDCGYRFREGEKYLVYAYEDEGKYRTSICTRTTHLDNANVDLEFLNRLPESLNATSITGKASLFVDNSISRYDLPVFKDLAFTIKNVNDSYEVKTDSNGVYYIEDIKPGVYEILIEKELNLVVKKDYHSEIEIEETDVLEYNIILTNINTVSGRVKDVDNQLITSGYVQLIPEQYFKDEENNFLYETFDCWLHKDGEFVFKNIPNGNYYLGINMDQEPWHVNPYSVTFYKNADSLASATMLALNGENNYTDINLIVKKVYKEYSIKCRLITSTGEVWNEAFVELKRKTGNNNWEFIAHGMKLNDKGEYIINTIENTEGWIVVEPRTPLKYYNEGLYAKKPKPVKIEPNKNYDDIEIIIEFEKR